MTAIIKPTDARLRRNDGNYQTTYTVNTKPPIMKETLPAKAGPLTNRGRAAENKLPPGSAGATGFKELPNDRSRYHHCRQLENEHGPSVGSRPGGDHRRRRGGGRRRKPDCVSAFRGAGCGARRRGRQRRGSGGAEYARRRQAGPLPARLPRQCWPASAIM